jgi:hypothetical protein
MGCSPSYPVGTTNSTLKVAEAAPYVLSQQSAAKGGGKEPSATELKTLLYLLEQVEIRDGKVNREAEKNIMGQIESSLNRQRIIDIAKGASGKGVIATKILRILFEINVVKKYFTTTEKREVKTIFQRDRGVTRRLHTAKH